MNKNKIPFKERKRHWDYQFNQTENLESRLLEKEAKLLEAEKQNYMQRMQESEGQTYGRSV